MKNYFVLFAVAFATILCTACKPKIHYCENSHLIYINTKDGTKFGLQQDHEITVPPVFSAYAFDRRGYTYFFFLDGDKYVYLFDVLGREILSGRTNEPGYKLSFDPIPIVNQDSYKITDDAKYYFGNLFSGGNYYRFPIADGTVYAAFDISFYQIYGPYKEFLPGCSGCIHQDPKTNKWGATAEYSFVSRMGIPHIVLPRQELFAPEYDEIIEVNQKDYNHFWFARKGTQWSAKKVYIGDFNRLELSTVTDVAVNQGLLNRVLKMRLQTKAKSRVRNFRKEIISGQRIGTKEASVVFL